MTELKPRNPDFEARSRQSFDRQKVMATLSMMLNSVEPGKVELEMPFHEDFTQQHGFLHAGIVSTALDSACGYAAFTLMAADAAVLTIEFKINLLSPARGERFVFRAEVTKPGSTITVADGKAFAVRPDGTEKLVATMTGTMMAIVGREGIEG
ncbi:PaaI family thioesterase [Hoeflea prorocentri]|uniref:Medium/long-chain acyl-CoA thioesterase YigI n=1 Tax=Hoeflea prorocentri TaxID=1922333 RepID=A0A9X3ZHK1_9HYPH|nr:PaaI family thioesterase [Hoeflea prorocentri]MCY6381927.1 PaaI family thioesterase [Hoeflea prorocentri]MDA5399727.1 PaaI family thioesterase [Hoeflea prorocentri]